MNTTGVASQWLYLTLPLWGGVLCGGIVNWLAGVIPNGFNPSCLRVDYVLKQQRSRLWVMPAAMVLMGYAVWYTQSASAVTTQIPLPLLIFYLALLLLFALIDIEHRRVPNVLVIPAAGTVLVVSLLLSNAVLLNAVIGGLVGFFCFFLIRLARPGAMGGGDVKLAGLIGIVTGFPLIIVALVVGIVAGGVGASILLLSGRVRRSGAIAYAPYLSLGGAMALLHGAQLIAWYLG